MLNPNADSCAAQSKQPQHVSITHVRGTTPSLFTHSNIHFHAGFHHNSCNQNALQGPSHLFQSCLLMQSIWDLKAVTGIVASLTHVGSGCLSFQCPVPPIALLAYNYPLPPMAFPHLITAVIDWRLIIPRRGVDSSSPCHPSQGVDSGGPVGPASSSEPWTTNLQKSSRISLFSSPPTHLLSLLFIGSGTRVGPHSRGEKS